MRYVHINTPDLPVSLMDHCNHFGRLDKKQKLDVGKRRDVPDGAHAMLIDAIVQKSGLAACGMGSTS